MDADSFYSANAPSESITIDLPYLSTRSETFKSDVDTPTHATGSEMTLDDISYTVRVGNAEKTILRNLSTIIPAGSLTALMGSTGGGKSTLLDTLAGRKDPKDISGRILVDGSPRPKKFKFQCGYVQQDDIVSGSLTVRENLLFSARLRLSNEMSDVEKQLRVDTVIAELGLSKVANSRVGDQMRRGVSGGERKRVNIGLELVKSPSVLFLDEPTTGLDANTAENLLELLSNMTKRGRTIILSIHQPRYSIYQKFDHLLLLTAGQFVYSGPAQKALEYFKHYLGYECEPFNNPADFFLDITNAEALARVAEDETLDSASPIAAGGDVTCGSCRCTRPKNPETSDANKSLAEKFLESEPYLETLEMVKKKTQPTTVHYDADISASADDSLTITYPIGYFRQTCIIVARNMRNLIRNPAAALMQLLVNIVFGLLAGMLYFQVGHGVDGLQNRTGALYFALMGAVFGNLSAVELFLSERAIFVNEKRGAYYCTEAYFTAKVVVDLLLGRLIPTLFYSVISFTMIGLSGGFTGFLVYLMMLELSAMTAVGICFLVSSLVDVFAVANVLTTMVYVVMLVFGGLFVNLDTMAKWFSWMQYVSLFRYGYEALAENELAGMVFDCGPDVPCQSGDQYLATQGFEDRLWFDVGMLTLFWFIFMFLCLIRLRCIH